MCPTARNALLKITQNVVSVIMAIKLLIYTHAKWWHVIIHYTSTAVSAYALFKATMIAQATAASNVVIMLVKFAQIIIVRHVLMAII